MTRQLQRSVIGHECPLVIGLSILFDCSLLMTPSSIPFYSSDKQRSITTLVGTGYRESLACMMNGFGVG